MFFISISFVYVHALKKWILLEENLLTRFFRKRLIKRSQFLFSLYLKNTKRIKWVWDVGVGETINIDEKGRIVIPAEIRKVIGRRKLNIEIADKDTIILRATAERNDLAEKIKKLKLIGDKNRSRVDFSDVKDVYGGKRVENP